MLLQRPSFAYVFFFFFEYTTLVGIKFSCLRLVCADVYVPVLSFFLSPRPSVCYFDLTFIFLLQERKDDII